MTLPASPEWPGYVQPHTLYQPAALAEPSIPTDPGIPVDQTIGGHVGMANNKANMPGPVLDPENYTLTGRTLRLRRKIERNYGPVAGGSSDLALALAQSHVDTPTDVAIQAALATAV